MAHAPLIVLVLVAGCGRLSFEARGDGGGGDSSSGDGAMSTVDAPVSNGLVAWYKLDGMLDMPPGVLDSSGNGHDGLCDSVCPVPATDRYGALGAKAFDGASTVLVIPTVGGGLDLTTFTISVWFHPYGGNANPFEILVSRAFGNTYENSFALDVATGSVLEYYAQPDNSLYGVSVYVFNQWQHAAISFDGTTKRLYYQGSIETQDSAAAAITFDNHPITIGADITNEDYAYHYEGALDDVMIFDRVLSPAEMAALAAL